MRAFEYANPTTIAEAINLLSADPTETQPLAGGTDLISLMKDDIVAPKRLVNLKSIAELQGIDWQAGEGLRIGAAATLDQLAAHAEAGAAFPALAQAIDGVRSAQLRNMGTVGGELLQRPRCWYYRSGFGLLATRDGEALVPDGDNRYHAILDNAGPAYFVHPSSLAPALIALEARVLISGPEGEREITVEALYRTPQEDGEREANLHWNEIVTHILVPDSGLENATYEVRQREALDWPLAAAAAAISRDGDRVQTARVVLGHVAPTPILVASAGDSLVGQPVTPSSAEAAGRAAVEGATALSHNGYKIQLAKVAAKRAILRAAGVEV